MISVFTEFILKTLEFFYHYFKTIHLFYAHGCLPACNSTQHMHDWCLQRSEESVGSHGTGVIDGCEPSGGCWESNLGLLREQPVLFIFEPSLKLLHHYSIIIIFKQL